MSNGPQELNWQFVSSLPDDGPVVMVNLVRFRERSFDGNGRGWDAYTRYSKADMPLLKQSRADQKLRSGVPACVA